MTVSGSGGFEETDTELEGAPLDAESKDVLRRRWESRQVDLRSHAVDFSVASVVDLVRRGDLDLNPEFERRDRWDLARRSRLIESFLLNIPIPPVFLSESDFGQYVVIDGRHRISALVDFINDDYAIMGLDILYEANGKKFSDLDRAMQRSLLSGNTVRAIILDRLSDPEMKYEVFARLNTGGVPLNAQELRNAVYPGPFNRLTVELSELPAFVDALQRGNASYDRIWREMGDVELVLRYFTLIDRPEFPSGPMSRALSETLQRKNNSNPEDISRDRDNFIAALEKCRSAFGGLVFRRWRPERDAASSQIAVSLYEAEMIAVRHFELEDLFRNSSEIQEGLKQLFTRYEFLQTLGFGMHMPQRIQTRVDLIVELIENVLE